MENLTVNTIENLQTEVSSLSKAVLQNQMSLDLLTAKKGVVWMIINISCCAYINKGRIQLTCTVIGKGTRLDTK